MMFTDDRNEFLLNQASVQLDSIATRPALLAANLHGGFVVPVPLPSLPVANNGGNGNDRMPANTEGDTSIQTINRVETPKMYKVILLNDDYTPMDFVVLILRRFFGKSEEQANQVMMDVHKKGAGVAGVYTLEVAEMKVMQVNQFSQMNEHPLKSTLEEE